ncbi:MAG TPA: MG2 domain-containing protein [Prolixibacteraceae bacterium]|nr:MG2 domain-containing protein [Prolixibacteraceae bacterium]
MRKLSPLYLVIFILFLCCLNACMRKEKTGQVIHMMEVDPGFSPYIEEYSNGLIPGNSSFKVKVTPAVAHSVENAKSPIDFTRLFTIEPSVKGECTYEDGTFAFKPNEKLEEGTEYIISFSLKDLLDVPEKYETLKFNIYTFKRHFSVLTGGLKTSASEQGSYSLQGEIVTSVPLAPADIEQVIQAEQEGKDLSIQWQHLESENRHLYTVTGIERKSTVSKVFLSWNGNDIDVKEKGERTVEIPALNVFSLVSALVTNQPEQQLKLIFSDPIDANQDLEGLVWLKGISGPEIGQDGNQLTIYLRERLSGGQELIIDKNIKSVNGQSLPGDIVKKIDFQLLKPSLRLPGRGVIMPDTGSVIFPFEAVNLKAVDLRIVKVFPSNMIHFLQNSSLNDTWDMKRVGKLIYSKRIDLVSNEYVDFNKWNAFSIDLSKHITIEKGAIYEVEIGMQKAYSVIVCNDNPDQGDYKGYDSSQALQNEKDYWEDPENWRDGYGDQYYDWQQYNNPCSHAYYNSDRNIKRNILVSNIGLTAKKGVSDEVLVACSDIQTAMPLSGVKLEIYNYQLQLIATGESNNDGFCTIQVSQKPFMLVAEQNGQKSYLKLNESNSLSLSQFDVAGEKVQKGIKAFIYTERGVWRPGDSIYTSVFIDDRYSTLPEKHPVIFKLMNPKGQILQEQIQNLDKKRLLTFRTATSPDAETGAWKAIVSIGGAEFTKYLRIETIKPNRLKINFTTKEELIRSEDLFSTAEIESNWLTGIKAPELRTVVDLSLRDGQTKFEDYPLFCFDDATKTFKYETKTLLDKTSDENGKVNCPLQLGKITDAPGLLNADFTIRVFEPGGDASIRQFTKKYSPFSKYAGLFIARENENSEFLKVDENSSIKLVSVNPLGEAVTDQLELRIYKMEWRWWWESSDENIGSYISRNNTDLKVNRTVEIKNGQVSINDAFSKLDWGRYLVVVQSSSGHTSSQTVYNRPDYYYEDQTSSQATMLSFTSDKKKYTAGENIHISFPAPDKGRALVTIENGTTVTEKFWVNTTSGNNELKIKATEAMAPCAYVHISLIQPFGQQNNDNPIRMYGVIPIPVENPGSRLNPVLQIPKEFRPERQVSLSVSEKNGKAMNYTIAMVDEGLLDLTGFQTPDPWAGIYQREALGVKTWDLFDEVLGAFGGKIEKLFAIGGDMNPLDPSKNKASRFKPVVRFLGPFRIEKGQTRKHTLDIPAYSGSVRTMIIAGYEGSYGTTEKTSAVKSPLMLQPVAPRSLGLEEEIAIPVSVFAQEASLKNVRVAISCSEHFSILSPKEMNLQFTEMGEKGLEFRIKTSEITGTGTITLTASSGNESTKYEINIPVKSKELPTSRSASKLLNAGEDVTQSLVPFGIKGSNKAVVTVSGLPSINLNSRLNYLIHYPHGCTEQTISSVFPQLYLSDIQKLDQHQKIQISNHVKAGIAKMKHSQNTDGSFGFWPGSSSNDEWLSNYAGHFLCEAELKGYTIPAQMKKGWLAYQARIASDWKGNLPHQKMVQAYRLYTLALADKPSFSAMNRLREDKGLPTAARWFLAAAYAESGRPEAAYELIDVRNVNPVENFNDYTYGDQTRDRAMLLLCMVRLNDQNNMFPLYQHIAKSLNSEQWMNTQTTSFALVAASKTIEKMNVSQKGLSYLLTVNKKVNESIKTTALLSTALETDLPGEQKVTIKNTSAGVVFVNYYTEGIPQAGQSEKMDRNLETSVRYIGTDKAPVDIAKMKQGTDFMAIVQVRNKSNEDVSSCALTFQVPSGWEIRNTRLFNQTSSVNEDTYDYRDFRDDKVCTYFDLKAGQMKTYLVFLNASYLGKYYFPNIQTEAMYDKNYLSVIPGIRVEVNK